MQDNFSTIRITDSRISTITDKPSIGVYGSGADITKQSCLQCDFYLKL